jgi:hypothetical protein
MDALSVINAAGRLLRSLPGWVQKLLSLWFRWWWRAGLVAKVLGAVLPCVVAGQVLAQSPHTAGLADACYAAAVPLALVSILAGMLAPARR